MIIDRLISASISNTDDEQYYFGTDNDFWFVYDEETNDAFEIWTADGDGFKTNTQLLSIPSGDTKIVVKNDLQVDGKIVVSGGSEEDPSIELAEGMGFYSIYPLVLGLSLGGEKIISISTSSLINEGNIIAGTNGWFAWNHTKSWMGCPANGQIKWTDYDGTSGVLFDFSESDGDLTILDLGDTSEANLKIGSLLVTNLPTSDPEISGQLWVDTSSSYVVKVSQG